MTTQELVERPKRAHWCGIGGQTCCHDLWCQVHETKRAFFDTSSWLWRNEPDPLLPNRAALEHQQKREKL